MHFFSGVFFFSAHAWPLKQLQWSRKTCLWCDFLEVFDKHVDMGRYKGNDLSKLQAPKSNTTCCIAAYFQLFSSFICNSKNSDGAVLNFNIMFIVVFKYILLFKNILKIYFLQTNQIFFSKLSLLCKNKRFLIHLN
jgi:hypothetical protein